MGTAEVGISGLATQAAVSHCPDSCLRTWELCQQEKATRGRQGEDELDDLVRVPEFTIKVLDITK